MEKWNCASFSEAGCPQADLNLIVVAEDDLKLPILMILLPKYPRISLCNNSSDCLGILCRPG